ncbi:MAG: DNA polymerase III subunit chi [Devosiaceae bacterium]|nr:DNA polymerase III subunit chi [Devosiaceae bacterium MH13]
MADIGFYHLTKTPLIGALAQLLEKTMQRGWNAVVELAEPEGINQLDEQLWTFSDASFLPHGRDGGPDRPADLHPERQPIWLTASAEAPNAARARFFVSGAMPEPERALDAYDRIVVMFDGRNDAETAAARACYKALRAAGHTLTYWQQNDQGGWQAPAN